MSNSNIKRSGARLDSDLLRTFLEVSATGSFSKAAHRIYRSQSAVSLQMKQLEASLGQALFQRHGRGVRLTVVGERLQPAALQVVSLLDHTAAELSLSKLQGSLRIGIPDEYGDSMLAQLIAQFARDNPGVELTVRCSFSAGFAQALDNDELDIAVHSLAEPGPNAQILRRQKTCWVASRHHRVHEQQPLPLALFDRACWWRNSAVEALTTASIPFREVFSSESVTGISAAVAAGVAVALIGEESLRDDFLVLTPRQGFPAMPESFLTLQVRAGAEASLTQAMCRVIESAFVN
jgi:DNA-binding transcriptional LysR family regulator